LLDLGTGSTLFQRRLFSDRFAPKLSVSRRK